jgi:Platelet-activating factor acetylhydrolase, isoform II
MKTRSPLAPHVVVVTYALAAWLACDDATDPAPSTNPAPEASESEETERFVVGTAAYEFVDAERDELLTPEPGDLREVVVRAWYPAAAEPTAPRAPYFLEPLEAQLNAQVSGLPEALFLGIESHAALNAPLAPKSERFPIIVFSPGMSTPSAFYGYQLAELASRGYVVFALSHSYATGIVVFSDGQVAAPVPETSLDERDPSISTWSRDQRFVLSQIEELAEPASGDRMAGRLDLDRVGVFGHSRGGAAAAQSCLDDARFMACANLDGSVSEVVMSNGVEQPFLLMRSELVDGTLGTFFDQLESPALRVDIAGAGHNNFSDLPLVIESLRGQIPEIDLALLLIGSIDAERAFEITDAYVSAFFDDTLRGRESPLMGGSSPYAEAAVTSR